MQNQIYQLRRDHLTVARFERRVMMTLLLLSLAVMAVACYHGASWYPLIPLAVSCVYNMGGMLHVEASFKKAERAFDLAKKSDRVRRTPVNKLDELVAEKRTRDSFRSLPSKERGLASNSVGHPNQLKQQKCA